MSEKILFERGGDKVIFIVERFLALGLLAAILLDFVNVIGRYSGGFSVLGIDEIEIYILIWIAFIGAVVVTWQRRHLRMDVLLEHCPRPIQKILNVVEMIVMFGVTAFVGYHSLAYVLKLYALGTISDIIGVPMWIPHSAVFLSFLSIAAITLIRSFEFVWQPKAGQR